MSTKSKMELGVGVKKPVRTISGVTPLTVVLEARKCDHGTCIYCPGGEHVPQSYTDKSPAIMRALRLKFNPYEQVKNRLKVLNMMNHPTDKIEIIILGGTFLQYPKEYKFNFIKRIFDALNGKDSKDLAEAKKLNEKAEHRCVALCIENRPDNCSPEDIKEMLEFGCTRVEMGVQMPDDELYEKTNRGHSVQDVIDATKNLKEAGFKIGYHMMPGLPYSNKEKDMELFKLIFESEDYRPDQLKLYPCQVVDDSPLGKIHEQINYKPYTQEETKEILTKMMALIPEYCRVMRVMREFPKEKLINGLHKLDLRKDIEDEIGGDLLDAGLTMGIFALVAGVTTLVSGKYADKVKRTELIVVAGYFIVGIGFLLYTIVDSIKMLFLVQIVVGFGEAIYFPAFDALYSRHISKKKAGRAWGAWESMAYFTYAGGAVIGAWIAMTYGFNSLFITMATLCFISAIYVYITSKEIL